MQQTTLRLVKLNDEISKQQRNVDKLKADLHVRKRVVNQHVALLTRLKLRAKRADKRYSSYQSPHVDYDQGLEWYSFRTAMRYGVSLEGEGWYTAIGQDRTVKALHTTFFYPIRVDKAIRTMIKKYIPGTEIKRKCTLIVCHDIVPALAVAQLVKPPTRISWAKEVVSDHLETHRRMYDRGSIKGVYIVRRTGGIYADR